MRTLRLARVAAEAEGLRLRQMAQRIITRIIMAVVALVFLIGTLVFIHVMLWYWLRLHFGWTQIWTAVTLGGGDLVIAALLVLLAARSSPGRIERDALEVRRRALASAQSSLAFSAMLMPVLRLVLRGRRR
jgi:hypothetical protein